MKDRHLEQIDLPTLREHEDREDDLVEIDEEDRLDRIDEVREVVLDLAEIDEVTGEDLGLDDLVMEPVEEDQGSDLIEEVTDRHLLSTKPEKLVLRELSSVISLHVVKQRDHREVIIGGKSKHPHPRSLSFVA